MDVKLVKPPKFKENLQRVFGFAATMLVVSSHGGIVLTSLMSFDGTNGWGPHAELTQGSDGSFYGSTLEGGAYTNKYGVSLGTMFKITKEGAFTTLVSFQDTNGWSPDSPLLEVTNGVFYGTTYYGG